MNRTTVLMLALVLLLAHMLAMHHDSSGTFALPSDLAHIDFKIARNAVHGQGTTWSTGTSAAAIAEEGGTSFLWICLAIAAEFFATSPVRISAIAGILSVLLTLALVARLSRGRLVGVTATALLVVSGPLAAIAADGTETALFTLCLAFSLFALERRYEKLLGLALALTTLTRGEGMLYSVVFLVLVLLIRRSGDKRLGLIFSFLPVLAATLVLITIRLTHGASALPPATTAPFAFDPVQINVGLWSLEALLRGSPALLLAVLPLTQLLFGRLSGTGKRALILAVFGSTLIVLQGASARPMHAAFVPILPLIFVAVQEGFTSGLDHKPKLEWAAWTTIVGACFISALASKQPGDLGPIPTKGLLRSMSRENDVRREAFGNEWNGRIGLSLALSDSARLRSLGLYLRSQTAPNATILSPWPGAIGYLSGRLVSDLLGRASSLDASPLNPWTGQHRSDVILALEARLDYVVPIAKDRKRALSQNELIGYWLERFDIEGPSPGRRVAMAVALEPYELIAVPTPARETNLDEPGEAPGFLLRLRSLGLSPKLDCQLVDGQLRVRTTGAGHHQIAELEVRATLSDGKHWYLAPTGEFRPDKPLRARTEILLFPTGDRRVELIRTQLPDFLRNSTITTRLLNPFSEPTDPLAGISAVVTLEASR